ncbi:MAG: hypothetical protein LBD14_00290 [Puniceicoccales bacterium]|jgi:type II secretory pathway pseudopilin PulG|nr:hypothetical protein [Puniceicoccales bacterium]
MKKSSIPSESIVGKRSRGFSLVLSLVVMSMLLLLVISLTAFLAVELRITSASVERERARLNAVVGLRVALGQLQQTAGADQRVTAQANVTLPVASGLPEEARTLWEGRNPWWTGVWDSRGGFRDSPPAWLVSGVVQTYSLAGKSAYPSQYSTPWEVVPGTDTPDFVTLFTSEAGSPEEQLNRSPFDTLVRVRRVPLKAAETRLGHYAYWVADEGVKARLNLPDRAAGVDAREPRGLARLLAAPGGAGAGLIPRWEKVGAEDPELARVLGTADYSGMEALSGLAGGAGEGAIPRIAQNYAHAVTAYSEGLFTSTTLGGLRYDLSLAFEMDNDEFARSDFTTGAAPVTVTFDPDDTGGVRNPRWEHKTLRILENSRNNENFRPMFNVKGVNGGHLFGPSWTLMRNYYRLYKPENFHPDGIFVARPFYPDAWSNRSLIQSRGGSETFVYSHIMRVQGCDINTRDIGGYSGLAVMRPSAVAATPHSVRYMLALGLQSTAEGASSEGKKVLRLVLNPIVVVHNPFNVPMRWRGETIQTRNGTERAGLRLSLRYDGAHVTIRNNKTGETLLSRSLQSIFKDQPGWGSYGGGDKDNISIFVPEMVLQPGEYRIFSAGEGKPEPWDRFIVGKNNFNYHSGYYFEKLNGAQIEIDPEDALFAQIGTAGVYVRELIKATDEGNLGANLTHDGDYYNAAEHQEYFFRSYNPACSGSAAGVNIASLPSESQAPHFFGYIEWFEKMTDWRGAVSTNNNIPTYAMTNPLGAVRCIDAYGNFGYRTSGNSWQYRIGDIPGGDLATLVETDGKGFAYGGNSMTSSGRTRTIRAHVPRAPMVGLGQFQTANINILDSVALYGVGHSFPSPYVGTGMAFDPTDGYTFYDQTWMLNTGLWDHFYFSTIAPEINHSNLNSVPTEVRNQQKVWADFLSPQKQTPLANPSIRLAPGADAVQSASLLGDPARYRKSAASLVQCGTFNINATDERAWRAILGSTRDIPLASSPAPLGGPSSGRAPFPRTLPVSGSDFATDNLADDNAWTSAKALNTAQIEKLARALVEKIRLRLAHTLHRAPYTAPTGEELCRPFLSIGEFVNRGLADQDEVGKLGVIQSALVAADRKYGAGINTGLSAQTITSAMLNDEISGRFRRPDVVDGANIPIATGAPGMLLQGDILQAIGARLNARSDTFVIRAYGDATHKAVGNTARAYLEAVVQRLPEYVDNTQTADIAPSNDPEGRKLNAVNQYFGRRFRILSLRWLSPGEL